jgi:hypothetical protein
VIVTHDCDAVAVHAALDVTVAVPADAVAPAFCVVGETLTVGTPAP